MKQRRRILGAVVLGAAVAVTGVGSATAATSATSGGMGQLAIWPSDCSTSKVYNGGSAKCTGGAGTYQVVVRCKDGRTVRGPWSHVGSTSWAFCGSTLSQHVSYSLRSD
ncbi:MAG: hypothetical protein ACTH2Q_00145 [Propionibacteriaceae bacterium]